MLSAQTRRVWREGKLLRTFPDHALAAALARPVIGLGLDISKDATRQASRRRPTFAFAVSDLWAEWPVRDTAVDLVLDVELESIALPIDINLLFPPKPATTPSPPPHPPPPPSTPPLPPPHPRRP